MQFLSFLAATVMGFFAFEIFSNPRKKTYQKLPSVKLYRLEILPNIRIHFRGRVIHLHHWMSLSLILIVTILYNPGPGFLDSIFAKGALFGGIAQGLTFPDWKTVIKKYEIEG